MGIPMLAEEQGTSSGAVSSWILGKEIEREALMVIMADAPTLVES